MVCKTDLTFVQATPESGRLDRDARKSVRSHAMKEFRRKQRKSRYERVRKSNLYWQQVPPAASLVSLCATQFQIQLQHHFRESCCPSNISGVFNKRTFRLDPQQPNGPAYPRHAASLALSTLNLALDSGSRKALHGFYQLYNQALSSLRSRTHANLNGEALGHVLAANYILSLVEAMTCHTHDNIGWQWHSKGLINLLHGSGSEAVAIADEQLKSIPGLQTWRTMALSRALIQRQGLPSLYFDQGRQGLKSIAFRVPGCLENLAALTDLSPVALIELKVQEALRLRNHLRNHEVLSRCAYDMANLADYPVFQTWLGGDLLNVFPMVYSFRSIDDAGLNQTRWMCLLELNNAILEALTLFSYRPEITMLNIDCGALQTEMDECADSLCRSLPFLSAPQMKSIGLVATTKPLYFARRHYERREMDVDVERKIAWCWRVDRNVTLGYRFRELGGYDRLPGLS